MSSSSTYEKGKIKNKYRKANASTILVERPNLINGGIQFFNLDKNKEALQSLVRASIVIYQIRKEIIISREF